jgi:acetate---CoA ligase (ADP-forming)
MDDAARTRTASHDHVLPDGTTVLIRPITPDDAGRLLEMWARTSAESRRARFLGTFDLNESNVHRFTDLDPALQYGIVATRGRGDAERIVGVGRYERDPDHREHAEFAALIQDSEQGRGIGTALVRQVAQAAADAGVRTLTGDILSDNVRMLNLVRELGLEYHSDRDFGGIVRSDLELDFTERFLDVVASAEKTAAKAALGRFFRPERVAVVGASRNKQSIGGLVFDNILQGGFQGVVYPVNPNAPYVQSVAAYPTLKDVPEVPDLVIVCVPGAYVNDVVDEAGELGVNAVCIVSAGFSEVDEEGEDRQADLLERARGHGLRIIGPNCMGLLNGNDDVRMNGTFSQTFPAQGRVSMSSQSGALGLAVLEHVHQLGLGISTFVSVGNKADISGNDLLQYWEDDEDTDVILMYLESFGNPRKFSRIARRVSRKKPIVAVKSGRTTAGVRAASSHTAAISSGDTAVDALFRQTGVIRTDTLEEMFEVATLLASQGLPSGDKVAVLTNAGGPGILAADALESNGLTVPPLSDRTVEQFRDFLPAEAGIGNPVDMIASASRSPTAGPSRCSGTPTRSTSSSSSSSPPGRRRPTTWRGRWSRRRRTSPTTSRSSACSCPTRASPRSWPRPTSRRSRSRRTRPGRWAASAGTPRGAGDRSGNRSNPTASTGVVRGGSSTTHSARPARTAGGCGRTRPSRCCVPTASRSPAPAWSPPPTRRPPPRRSSASPWP